MHTSGEWGQGYSHQYLTTLENLDQIYNAVERSGEKAFGTAGIEPKDVDIAFLYDCLHHNRAALNLRDWVLFPREREGAFALEGRMEIGKDLPVNTHGGLLSQAHLGAMHQCGGSHPSVERRRGKQDRLRTPRWLWCMETAG